MGRSIDDRELQRKKTVFPILTIVEGITTLVIEDPLNASVAKLVIVEEITITPEEHPRLFLFSQPLK